MKSSQFASHWAGLQRAEPVLSAASTHWIALSGGADSVALLHLFSSLPERQRQPLRVVHVNHGLADSAPRWAEFCDALCQQVGLPFELIELSPDLALTKQLGTEAWARAARYDAIERLISDGDVVHTGQHLNDQAETLLLALMRGSGSRGQAAMPLVRELGRGWLCRPLIGYSREQLREVPQLTVSGWIDDPSNTDNRFDRNFLRNTVLPQLAGRWPSVAKSLSRSADVAAAERSAQDWFVERWFKGQLSEGGVVMQRLPRMSTPASIHLSAINPLPLAVRQVVLRYWVSACGLASIPFSKLLEVERSVLCAADDKAPILHWADGVTLARFDGRLWLFTVAELEALPLEIKLGEELNFDGGVLTLVESDTGFDVPQDGLSIATRSGGERFRKTSTNQSTQLKKYLNERRVFPWWRDCLPLFSVGNELVAIGNLWQLQDKKGGWQLQWSPAPRVSCK